MTTALRPTAKKPPPKNHKDEAVEHGSGNVFNDLGLQNAIIDQAKAELAVLINGRLAAYGSTQVQRARALGVSQSTLSLLENFELARFSVDRLCRYAAALDIKLNFAAEPPARA